MEDTSLEVSEDTSLEKAEDTSLGEEEVNPLSAVEDPDGSCISDGQRVIVTFYNRGLNKFYTGAKIFPVFIYLFIYSVIFFPTALDAKKP